MATPSPSNVSRTAAKVRRLTKKYIKTLPYVATQIYDGTRVWQTETFIVSELTHAVPEDAAKRLYRASSTHQNLVRLMYNLRGAKYVYEGEFDYEGKKIHVYKGKDLIGDHYIALSKQARAIINKRKIIYHGGDRGQDILGWAWVGEGIKRVAVKPLPYNHYLLKKIVNHNPQERANVENLIADLADTEFFEWLRHATKTGPGDWKVLSKNLEPGTRNAEWLRRYAWSKDLDAEGRPREGYFWMSVVLAVRYDWTSGQIVVEFRAFLGFGPPREITIRVHQSNVTKVTDFKTGKVNYMLQQVKAYTDQYANTEREARGRPIDERDLVLEITTDTLTEIHRKMEGVLADLEIQTAAKERAPVDWANYKIRTLNKQPVPLHKVVDVWQKSHEFWNHIALQLIKVYEDHELSSTLPDQIHYLLEEDAGNTQSRQYRIKSSWKLGPTLPMKLIKDNPRVFAKIPFAYQDAIGEIGNVFTYTKKEADRDRLYEIADLYRSAGDIMWRTMDFNRIAAEGLVTLQKRTVGFLVAPDAYHVVVNPRSPNQEASLDLQEGTITKAIWLRGEAKYQVEVRWKPEAKISITMYHDQISATATRGPLQVRAFRQGKWLERILPSLTDVLVKKVEKAYQNKRKRTAATPTTLSAACCKKLAKAAKGVSMGPFQHVLKEPKVSYGDLTAGKADLNEAQWRKVATALGKKDKKVAENIRSLLDAERNASVRAASLALRPRPCLDMTRAAW